MLSTVPGGVGTLLVLELLSLAGAGMSVLILLAAGVRRRGWEASLGGALSVVQAVLAFRLTCAAKHLGASPAPSGPGSGGGGWPPVSVVLAVPALLLASGLLLAVQVRALRQASTALTFKAAFDTYPGALAISGGAGRPSFVNDTMRLLLGAHGIRGAWPLEDIWEALRDRAVEMRIQGGGEECMPVEAQGRLWALTRARDGTGGYELSGQDITEVETLTRELAQEVDRLEASTLRLRTAIDEVGRLLAERDVLMARARLHDVLAQRLTFAKKFLQEGVGDADRLQVLSGLLAGLTEYTVVQPGVRDAVERLEDVVEGGELVGTQVIVTGDLPQDQEIALLLVEVLGQAVTNAVLHAGARRVDVVLEDVPGDQGVGVSMTVRNAIPEAPGAPTPSQGLRERTGMRGMRQRLVALGGVLETEVGKEFVLRASIPPCRESPGSEV